MNGRPEAQPIKIMVAVDDLEALLDQYDPTGELSEMDPDLAWIPAYREAIAAARATP